MGGDRRPLILLGDAVLAGVCAVVLLALASPPMNWGALAWVALIPAFGVLPRLSGRGAEWFGFLTGYAFSAWQFRWLWAVFGFPAIALWGILGLFWGAYFALARLAPDDRRPWLRAAALASLWVALEFFRSEQWFLRFSWPALGFTQHNQPALQAASWIGVYGLSFLIVYATALAASRRGPRFNAWLAVALGVNLGGLAVERSWEKVNRREDVSAVLVQAIDASASVLTRLSDEGLAESPAPAGAARIVVWPEYALQADPRGSAAQTKSLQDLAHRWDATFVFGATEDLGGDRFRSAAFVVSPNGTLQGTAAKHNPLPFFKDGEPTRDYPLFRDGNAVPFGVLICFDMSFERNARMLANNGARYIVVPSEELPEWGPLERAEHAIVAPVRAVETRRSILRANSSGFSQVVAPSGDVLVEAHDNRRQYVAWAAPAVDVRTPYVRFGWLLPWLCQAVTAVWLGYRLLFRRRDIER
jgi:apolipoprotein N-acyltransferase